MRIATFEDHSILLAPRFLKTFSCGDAKTISEKWVTRLRNYIQEVKGVECETKDFKFEKVANDYVWLKVSNKSMFDKIMAKQ